MLDFHRPALAVGLIAAVLATAAVAAPSAAAPTTAIAPAPSPETQHASVRRFALVVGTNDGGVRRVKLRYAHSDASTFAGVLTELGGVRPDDLFILEGPGRKQFLAALDAMKPRLAAAAGSAGRLELLVYYSGHSDETGLLLGEEKLAYGEFRARIDAVPAKIRLAVVDACASGALTRLKGGKRLPAFAVDQSSSLSGYAFLTSSSGTEAAQESDRIRASYFTHFLVTGLRGAADLNLDGKVTLSEAYEFAFHETLSQTEGSQAGAQHPSYDMRLTGTGDLVLTDLRGTSAGLVLDKQLHGRLFIRSGSGALVAELQKMAGRKVELGLEPGLYDMRLDQGNAFYRGLVKVDSLSHLPVALKDFEPAPREKTRERGGSDSLEESVAAGPIAPTAEWIPARAALVPALGYPGLGAGPWSHNLSVNLFVGEAHAIHGLQFSLLFNRNLGDMRGLQAAAGFNVAVESEGVQLGFGNAVTDHRGIQVGAVNIASRTTGVQAGALNAAGNQKGLQAGLANGARERTGAQVGLVNAAWRGTGAQIGVLNAAGRFKGAQVGLINVAGHSEGAVIGLLNIIGNGLHDLETTVDEKSMLRTALLLGGTHNYTWYSFDMKARSPRHLWGGSAGLGLHLPRKPFYLDWDLGGGWLGNENDWDNYSVTARTRGLLGYQPMRYFSLFGGLSYNLEAWPGSRRSNLNPGSTGRYMADNIRYVRWIGVFLGVRL